MGNFTSEQFLEEKTLHLSELLREHLRRVGILSGAFFQYLLTNREKARPALRNDLLLRRSLFRDTLYAASLHDIGKCVWEEKLHAAAVIEDTQWQAYQKHCLYGEYIIKRASAYGARTRDSKWLITMEVAKKHHEWWNGEGYPSGEKGESMILPVRICAVADTYDNLVCKSEANEEAQPFETALEKLDELSGIQLDPGLVQMFTRMMKQQREAIVR